MVKDDLLKEIEHAASNKLVVRQEVVAAFDRGASEKPSEQIEMVEPTGAHVSISEILYYVGGAIVVVGIGIFIAQNWTTLSPFTKILSTLGSAIVAYIVGVLLMRDSRFERMAYAFYLIFGLTAPMGLYTTFDVAGLNTETFATQSMVSGILVAASLYSFYALRRDLFIIFTILYGTWAFFALTSLMIQGDPRFTETFFQYRLLFVGMVWVLLGYSMTQYNKSSLSGFLYGFGVAGFLGSALMLTNLTGSDLPGGANDGTTAANFAWQAIYPGLIFAVFFLSTILRSRSFLVFAAIFLMVYIFMITARYFSQGLGWSLSLVIVGLCLIGVGYLTVYLNKRYLTK